MIYISIGSYLAILCYAIWIILPFLPRFREWAVDGSFDLLSDLIEGFDDLIEELSNQNIFEMVASLLWMSALLLFWGMIGFFVALVIMLFYPLLLIVTVAALIIKRKQRKINN